jgi:hypothetical protein
MSRPGAVIVDRVRRIDEPIVARRCNELDVAKRALSYRHSFGRRRESAFELLTKR